MRKNDPSKRWADKTEPVTVSVASVDDDSDHPFAVAEDLGGTPLVSTAANPEKEPEAAPEDSAPATPEASQPVQAGQGRQDCKVRPRPRNVSGAI